MDAEKALGAASFLKSKPARELLVVADDFGIGPATSIGILELARKSVLTGTVLLVNSPYAEAGVTSWRAAGRPLEMGWHPNLTLDKPVLPPGVVPSLVGPDGCFWPLGVFLKRMFLGRIRSQDVEREWRAQYQRFVALVGLRPKLINSHQHVALFPSIGIVLLSILQEQRPHPYIRRVQEPWTMLWAIPGARRKRAFLNLLGRRMSRWQERAGFPGNEWLAGVTDPPWVRRQAFFRNWLGRIPGRVVELACHPGHRDESLIGRDCTLVDGLLQRRIDEWHLLNHPDFLEAVAEAGFTIAHSERFSSAGTRKCHAA
ncbi:MAG: ChbG/HpnK family deacetylase [Planctomycetes bacterium]|nr:ChbG/HpnK family deacetylase [Planctomycetota bacterium]